MREKERLTNDYVWFMSDGRYFIDSDMCSCFPSAFSMCDCNVDVAGFLEDVQEAECLFRDCFPDEEIFLEERGRGEVYDQDGELVLEEIANP